MKLSLNVYLSFSTSLLFVVAGYISTSTPLDRETTSSYKLTVKAADNGNPSLTSTATVYINVNDLNDNSPVFSQDGTYEASVQEEEPTGTFVAWIVATDEDSGVLGNISYSLVDGKFDSRTVFTSFSIHMIVISLYIFRCTDISRKVFSIFSPLK